MALVGSIFEEEYYNTIKMGKDWGTLAKMSGITYFRLSSYEQKAFSGIIKDGLPNLIRTTQQLALRAGPFFLGTYLLMEWADAEYRRLNRKPHSH